MYNPMIIWYVVVGLLLLVFAWRFFYSLHVNRRRHPGHARRFVEIGRERDMFYIPGDPVTDNDDDLSI
jgi:hypothetical protein